MSTTTDKADAIASALFPKARHRVLGLLFAHPEQARYLREIVEQTGLGVGHVQRELERLTQAGVIRRSRRGRHVYFEADTSCPIFEELRRLVMKTTGVVSLVRQALASLGDRIAVAFVYGSVARGEDGPQSDLDLMVIGTTSFAEVAGAIRAAERSAGREINPTVYSPEEFRAKLDGGHHFLRSVMEGEKIFVAGEVDELGKLRTQ